MGLVFFNVLEGQFFFVLEIMSRFVRPLGSAGIAVNHARGNQGNVLSAYQTLCFQYKRNGITPPPRKPRFESPARTKFLKKNKKPMKQWMRRSANLMEGLDAIADRGM